MKTSVIVSTYNAPQWLEKVLWGFSYQTVSDFEVIVADDGSTHETGDLIEKIDRDLADLRIKRVWQPDNGFRKCRVLNKAIIAAEGDYLIFTDGDCIPRKDFVEVHRRGAKPGYFLSGGLFRLPMHISQQITQADIAAGRSFDLAWLQGLGLKRSKKTRKLTVTGSRAQWLNLLTPARRTWNGHNSSVWRESAIAVNGFDERLQYGGEDREFGERLKRAGFRCSHVRYSAICVHLDHARAYVRDGMVSKNRFLRKLGRQEKRIQTEYGLRELEAGAEPARIPVSVFVVTYNEQANIQRLLASIQDFDEVVVVDSDSTDDTRAIARSMGACVYRQSWLGYAKQKELAMSHCRNEWVLNLDADEEASEEMRHVVRETIKSSNIDAVRFKRNDKFVGKFLPKTVNIPNTVRLYRKTNAHFDDRRYVHERATVIGNELVVTAPILHYGYEDIPLLMDKNNRYSTLKAREKYDQGKKGSRLKLFLIFPMEFLRKFLLHRYVFFGWRGLILSIINAHYAFSKEAKLLALWNKESNAWGKRDRLSWW